jgi:cell division septation protein DedD
MAPVISRMEPVGRGLAGKTPPRPKPQTKTPAIDPPRTRLPAPPIAQPQSQAQIQTPAPVQAPAVNNAPGPPLENRRYTVLLGAFGKQENALNLKNRLESAGLPVSISEVTEKNKLWYRVMSGTFEDRNSAEAYSRELRQRKLVDRPYVRPL